MKESEKMLKCLTEDGIDTFTEEYLLESIGSALLTIFVAPYVIGGVFFLGWLIKKDIEDAIKSKREVKFGENFNLITDRLKKSKNFKTLQIRKDTLATLSKMDAEINATNTFTISMYNSIHTLIRKKYPDPDMSDEKEFNNFMKKRPKDLRDSEDDILKTVTSNSYIKNFPQLKAKYTKIFSDDKSEFVDISVDQLKSLIKLYYKLEDFIPFYNDDILLNKGMVPSLDKSFGIIDDVNASISNLYIKAFNNIKVQIK